MMLTSMVLRDYLELKVRARFPHYFIPPSLAEAAVPVVYKRGT